MKITETKIKTKIAQNPKLISTGIQTEPVELTKKYDRRNQEIQIDLDQPDLQAKLDLLNQLAEDKNKRIAAKISMFLGFAFYLFM